MAPYFRNKCHAWTVLIASAISFLLGRQTSPYDSSTFFKAQRLDDRIGEALAPQNEKDDTGWHQIDVFYGASNQLEAKTPLGKEWTSQADQDRTVFALLNNKTEGYFVDLAANDATLLSNTYNLESRYGWNGLCIEPNFIYWYGLASRPRCQVVGAVVGHETVAAQVNFTFARAAFGGIVAPGFDNEERQQHHAGQRRRRNKRPPTNKARAGVELRYTVKLAHLFARYNVPSVIDYFSLDVEGAEWDIMNDFPFDSYTMKIMTVERPNDELKESLFKSGYVLVKQMSDFGEMLYCHQSVLSMLNFRAAGIEPPSRTVMR